MKQTWALFFFFLSLNISPQAQTASAPLAEEAATLAAQGDFDKASGLLLQAMEVSVKDGDWPAYLQIGITYAANLKKLEGPEPSRVFLLSLLRTGREKLGTRHGAVAAVLHKLGVHHYVADEYEEAVAYFNQALAIRQAVLPPIHPDLANNHYVLGVCLPYTGNYPGAFDHLKAALDIYKQINQPGKIADCEQELAKLYTSEGEYSIAQGYYQSALERYQALFGKDSYEVGFLYNRTGILSFQQKKFDEAVGQYNEAIKAFNKNTEDNRDDIANTFNNLANAQSAKGNYQEALNTYRRVLGMKEAMYGDVHLEVASIWQNIGDTYLRLRNPADALEALGRALAIRKKILGEKKHPKYNKSYHNLGWAYLEMKDFPKALAFFQKAIQQQILNFNEDDIFKNPDLKKAEFLDVKPSLLADFEYKAKAFVQWYALSGDIRHLQGAWAAYHAYGELTDLMRADFTAGGSKLFWLQETYPVFEAAISTALLLFEKTGEAHYRDDVFFWMEKNKAVLLLESLNAAHGKTFANIPDSLLHRQASLRQRIADKERDRLDLKQEPSTPDSVLAQMENEIFRMGRQLQGIEEQLQQKFPAYHRLLQDFQVATVPGIQRFLNDQQMLIEFFTGDSLVFGVAISRRSVAVHTVQLASIQPPLARLRALLTKLQPDDGRVYSENALLLYQLLLDPLLAKMPSKADELFMVPDGLLSYLPFDVLLYQEPTGPGFSVNMPYLLQRWAVSYGYSATILLDQPAEKHNHNMDYLGIAPSFSGEAGAIGRRACEAGQLARLMANQEEVEGIGLLFPGQTLLGESATKEAFLKHLDQCGILHLATHACVDDADPAQSRIYFQGDYLYAHELYNLELPCRMVVLSACETGTGTFRRGEGVMSLGRGFAYAGTPSITTSLWSANDNSTASLMRSYYSYLHKGWPKHKALRQAKLDYLSGQESVERLHPYFWAAFIHAGDVAPIKGGLHLWWYLLGAVAVAAMLFYLRKKVF